MDEVECTVVGAGVIGLAVARAQALAGREVMVLEGACTVGTGVSSRSSEVIHAGLHGEPGWLKAALCVRGRQLLYDYCEQRAVAHRRCGKLLVATQAEQLPALQALAVRAAQYGVIGLQWLSREQAIAMEPALACQAALWSPDSGIVDSHGLMQSLQGDLEQAGGLVVFNTAVVGARVVSGGFELRTAEGAALRTRLLVNSAGLGASALAAQTQGLAAQRVPLTRYAKGHYFVLKGRAPFSRLVYPMPTPGGLGVHLTLDLGNQARFGPDVQWVDAPDDLAVDPARASAFESEVRRYWPGLPDGALVPAYAGIRPKIHGPHEPARDFLIQGPADHGLPGLVNLFGMESPGLTSSLAVAEQVARILAD